MTRRHHLTSTPSLHFNPVWSSDGRQVFYQSNNSNIYARSSSEGTFEQPLLSERTMVYPSAVSPNGSVLLYTRATGPSVDLWYVPLGAERTPHLFVQTTFNERDGQFSPDGKRGILHRDIKPPVLSPCPWPASSSGVWWRCPAASSPRSRSRIWWDSAAAPFSRSPC